MKALYKENGQLKSQWYAVDWVEKKTFLWCVNDNLPIGTEYWILTDEDVKALNGITESEYSTVLELGKPDGVTIGQEAYEKLHPETSIPIGYHGTWEEYQELNNVQERSEFEITPEEFADGNKNITE